MKGTRYLVRLCIAGVAGTLALTGIVPAAATTGVGGGPIAESILGSGSDTSQFMMAALDNLYLFSPGCASIPTPSGPTPWLDLSCQAPDPAGTITTENYQHDQTHEAYFLGSSNGINQLCEQGQANVARIDFARSSRAPKGTDCTGLHFVAYARDALSWEAWDKTAPSGIHNMNNQTGTCAGSGGATQFCLTQSQLQGIFVTCTITNWSQVGGNNVKIQIYTAQAGSGTRSAWDGFVGGDSSHCIPAAQLATHVIPENRNTGIPTANQKGAIFPFSYGVWSTQIHGKGGAKLGAIDNVAVTATTIADGSFPYGRFIYNVFCADSTKGCAATTGVAATPETVKYVGEEGWICKGAANHATNPVTGNNYATDIANTITAQGFVPIPNGVIGGGDPNSDNCRLFTT